MKGKKEPAIKDRPGASDMLDQILQKLKGHGPFIAVGEKGVLSLDQATFALPTETFKKGLMELSTSIKFADTGIEEMSERDRLLLILLWETLGCRE